MTDPIIPTQGTESIQAVPLPADPAPAEAAATPESKPADPAPPAEAKGEEWPLKTALTGSFGEEGEPAVDAAPDAYELTFGEGVQVDTELLSSFQVAAKEIGLSQEHAQKLATLYEGYIGKANAAYQDAQAKALRDYVTEQNKAMAEKPGFKEDIKYATAAFKAFGSEELAGVMASTAIGSHPAMVDFFAKIGRLAEKYGEPGFKGTSSATAQPQSLADRMFPGGGRGFNDKK
jgi:hypothetical protein